MLIKRFGKRKISFQRPVPKMSTIKQDSWTSFNWVRHGKLKPWSLLKPELLKILAIGLEHKESGSPYQYHYNS